MRFGVVNFSCVLKWHRYEDFMKEFVFKPRKFFLSRTPGGSRIFHKPWFWFWEKGELSNIYINRSFLFICT